MGILPLEKRQSFLELFVAHRGPTSPSVSGLQNAELLPHPAPWVRGREAGRARRPPAAARPGREHGQRPLLAGNQPRGVPWPARHLPAAAGTRRWIAYIEKMRF